MTEAPVLQIVTQALEHAAIPYMITGSFASNFYGIPRTTRDIDIVIAANPEQLKGLIQQLQDQNYHAQIEDAFDALRHHSMFNVIEPSMVWKIDFIMRKPGTFSQEAFRRRVSGEIAGITVQISTAEDLIIAKLDWAKQGESYRQLEDVSSILKIRWESLDHKYIENWVAKLALTSQWNVAKQIADIQ